MSEDIGISPTGHGEGPPSDTEQVFDQHRSRRVGFLVAQPVTAMAAPAMIMRAPATW